MLQYMHDKDMKRDYAYLTEGTEDEQGELVRKGFIFFSRYKVTNREGKQVDEELWIK